MVVSTVIEAPDVLVATVTGTMTTADQIRLVAWIRTAIRQAGPVRVLVRLDGFAGWLADDANVDPTTTWLRDDEPVRQLAIVGDPRWRPQVLTMTAQPVRGIPIHYFETEAAARAWLEGRVATSPSHPTTACE